MILSLSVILFREFRIILLCCSKLGHFIHTHMPARSHKPSDRQKCKSFSYFFTLGRFILGERYRESGKRIFLPARKQDLYHA